MFAMAHDTAFGLAVFLFTGDTAVDEDFEAYIAGIELVKAWHGKWSEAGSTPACGILVVDPGAPIPDAHWRRRIADASKDVKPGTYFAVVSTLAIVRGVVTAMNWIRPPTYVINIVGTFTAAVQWMESQRGVRLPAFHDLLQEARARAARGERAPARSRTGGRADA